MTASVPFDDVVHQPIRLQVLAALRALPPGEMLEFQRLKAIVSATDGNMGTHLGVLEQAGYIAIHKDFFGKRPRTRAAITPIGCQAFDRHVRRLRDLLDGVTLPPGD